MKLVLIGFMGSGKSVLSRLLAERLSVPHVDTDALALARSQRGSIAEIFNQDGEAAFRALEQSVCAELAELGQGVMATGGGLVMNQIAVASLRQQAQVIYLKTSLETILSRVGDDESRPLLQDKLHLAKLYAMRCALYEYYADWAIDTDGQTPEQLADVILAQLQAGKTLVSLP